MFTDAIELNLKLTISQKSVDIAAGNVKLWELDLHNWGFTGRAEFAVSLVHEDDSLFELFTGSETVQVELKFKPYYIPEGTSVEYVELKGLVTHKAITAEQTIERGPLKGNPVVYRMYEIFFVDPAQAVWKCHRPLELMTDKSVKDLLQAHKTSRINLNFQWKVLNEKLPMLALYLGSEAGKADFYDFVMWYVDTRNGIWSFDASKNSYTLSETKDTEGEPDNLNKDAVQSLRMDFPEPPRERLRLLNSFAENPQTKKIENKLAMEGITRDILVNYPVTSDLNNREALEKKRQKIREHELLLYFSSYPMLCLIPGKFLKLEKGLWSENLYTTGKTYRIRSLHIKAGATDANPDSDRDMPFNRYEMEMCSRLETKDETWQELPEYVPPAYPVYLEGLVVSEHGDKDEETYQIHEDSKTSQRYYKVKIPLLNNQELLMPFMPLIQSGHFYFPVYKGARVLVALEFDHATMAGCLDWRGEAQVPADTQGNRIMMGKTPTSRTAISHVYQDNLPVFAMERQEEKDTESITFSQGRLVIQTSEKKG
ncbi:conserved hypothetical protein [Desulfonatronospira thiodismutans ASO3-1]|uniref:Uncharacterized protein n=1 Tax=Desulfonatronospira thiodismutans ASO3-1 TaxID=555779 RepID=D6SPQ0_9BACT|nr:hypothetical protein [Desulfonatronospira thiodismutans]EFI34726.1 conserved hypothetical protein [Desulfonatronospira thiodismutans ASO3-1]